METTEQDWCIRIGEVFDFAVACECLRHCRDDRAAPPARLLFDLTRTRLLSTAGIGTMLHIKNAFQVTDDNAVIVYQDAAVGELLRVSRIHRSFQIQAREATPGASGNPSAHEWEWCNAAEATPVQSDPMPPGI
jgi:anti-anti-sigma regulatory factor